MDKLNSSIPFFHVQEDFLIHVPRQRTKTKRFGDMDEILDLTSDDSDEETKTKPPPAASNKKPKEKREPSQRPPKKQVQCGWTRLECFRVEKGLLTFGWVTLYRPYAYDVIISLRPHFGGIGLRVNAVVSDVPAADHKRVQGNGFIPQHGSAMTSMHKVYNIKIHLSHPQSRK